MKRKLFYTKYALRCFKIISALCVCFLITIEVDNIRKGAFIDFINTRNYCILILEVVNFLAIFFFIFSYFFPQRFGGLSFIAYMYSFLIILFEPSNYMGILMFFLGTTLLCARGLMNKHKKIKTVFISVFFILLNLSYIRFGFSYFLNHFFETLGVVLVLCLIIFLMRGYYINTLVYEDKKLNLALYPKLTERDCRVLKKIQIGEKYVFIAKEEGLTEGSLKNRLHVIFDTLETGDKQGFLSYYSDWEIFFEPIKSDKIVLQQ